MIKRPNEIATIVSAQAAQARAAILQMTTLAGSGHPGGSMSSLDLLLCLYNTIDHDPQNPYKPDRDRIVISHGHISPAVYSSLALNGYFTIEEAISQYRIYGTRFEGHVERDLPGIEWSTGNLGQGLSAGAGFTIANRIKGIDSYTYVMMGDGEQQKGQISEARRFAAKYKLNKLIAIIDYNQLQICGTIHEVMPQNMRKNWESDGWQVLEVSGHDIMQILKTLDTARKADQPTLILAHTVMGRGVSFMENKAQYHGAPLKREQCEAALAELGQPSELDKYAALREDVRQNPPQHELPDFAPKYELKAGKAILYTSASDCRSGWGNAISDLAKINKGSANPIVVVDCDLSGSVKTADFAHNNPEHFLQVGIMEHHAAVMSGAISTTGIQCFWADFGVFGIDEVYNMQRLNLINRANLKTVITHVGIDVGADGKTHQCVDYISLVRNIFGYRVICPADANQTDRIIRWLIDKPGNYLVAMGRSKLPIIQGGKGEIFFDENYVFEYGKADTLREGKKATVFVCGTPLGRVLNAVDELAAESYTMQVINVSSPLEIEVDLVAKAAKRGTIFTVEDHSIQGGLGTTIAEAIVSGGYKAKLVKIGVDTFPRSAESEELYMAYGMDSQSLKKRFREG